MGLLDIEAEHHRQKRMELEGTQMLIAGAPGMIRKLLKWCLIGLVLVMAVGAASGHRESGGAVASSCHGKVAKVYLPELRYPGIVAHIRYSWAHGYPKTLRIHREGAKQRRDRLLGWWGRRHPQPKGDGMDLDEAPAAVLRDSWRADVRPIPAHENRSAGASLGAQIAGVPNGTCVRYRFA